MKRIWIVLPLVAAAFGATGCADLFKKKDPSAVNALEAVTTESGDLVVTWINPTDFHDIAVTIERPGTQNKTLTVPRKLFDGFNTAEGPARLVLLEPEPGMYTVSVRSKAGVNVDARTAETKCIVPPPPSGGFITRNDIEARLQTASGSLEKAATKQTLDVLFMIHPDALEALGRIGPQACELFRQTTAGALTNVFDTAFEVDSRNIEGDTDGLGVVKRIEEYASLVEASGKIPRWPLHPDAVVLVDIRLTSSSFPGQLLVRLYDLRLTTLVENGVVLREMLYNVRPLVYEQFTNLRQIRHPDNKSEIAKAFREAWLECVSRMLCHPRFAEYSTLAMRLQGKHDPSAVTQPDRDRIQNLILARLTGEMKPFDPAKEERINVMVYERRARTLMTDLLFGPGVPGPMDIQPNSRIPARPAKTKPRTPAKTDGPSKKNKKNDKKKKKKKP
jgi:hypothetical protein